MVASAQNLIGLGEPPALAGAIGNTLGTLAGVGTTQALGKVITTRTNLVNMTTSGGATAFTLSDAWGVGDMVTVFNSSATAALLFPQVGGAIDAGSTDASVSIAQNEGRTFYKMSSTVWRSGEAVETLTSLTISGTLAVTGVATFTAKSVHNGGLNTIQALTNTHDTTPTAAELASAFGAAATLGRGFIGTVDDNDGDTNGYLVFTSDASFYFPQVHEGDVMLERDHIISRRRVIQAAYDQHVANANAAKGALAECDHWLSLLDEAPEEKPAPKKRGPKPKPPEQVIDGFIDDRPNGL